MRRILAAMVVAMSFIGANASAYDVLVYNCLKNSIRVVTYDDGDGVMMIPYAEYSLSPLSVSVVKCNGRAGCKVHVYYDDMAAAFVTGGPLYIKTRHRGLYSVASCDA